MIVASRLYDRSIPDLAERAGDWRSVSLLTRIAFFILGLVAATLTIGIIWLLHLPQPLIAAGALLVGVAEWLIATRHLSHAGIEEALHIAGLLLVALATVDGFSGSDTGIAIALCIAFALGGWRLRNPLFTTLSGIACSVAVATAFGGSSLSPHTSNNIYASLFCYVVAFGALVLGARLFQRPSHDRMLDWLVVAMPVMGYGWTAQHTLFGAGFEYLQQPFQQPFKVISVLSTPLLFAAVALPTSLRRRTHAPLLSGMACIVCIAYELRAVSGWSLAGRLIIWGSAALALAIALNRLLRTPRCGITSRRIDAHDDPLDLLQLVGAALNTPLSSSTQSQDNFKTGEGRFGGGGASAKF